MMSEGKKIKDRSHALFLELKPIFKVVEEGNNKNLSRYKLIYLEKQNRQDKT